MSLAHFATLVSLHNSALVHMDENPNDHLDKLHFLLGIPQAPFPTFSNLLLLYVKYGLYDVAADALAANPQLAYSQLDPVSHLHSFSLKFH